MFVPLPLLIAIAVAFLVLLAWVARLSRRRDPLLGGQPPVYRRPPPQPQPVPTPIATLPPEAETQVRALLSAGRKIDAIKLARDITHLGLKDAKDLVESME